MMARLLALLAVACLLLACGCDGDGTKPQPKPKLKAASLEINIEDSQDTRGACRLIFTMKSDAKTPGEAIDLALASLKEQAPRQAAPQARPAAQPQPNAPSAPQPPPVKPGDLPAGTVVPPGYGLPDGPPERIGIETPTPEGPK